MSTESDGLSAERVAALVEPHLGWPAFRKADDGEWGWFCMCGAQVAPNMRPRKVPPRHAAHVVALLAGDVATEGQA